MKKYSQIRTKFYDELCKLDNLRKAWSHVQRRISSSKNEKMKGKAEHFRKNVDQCLSNLVKQLEDHTFKFSSEATPIKKKDKKSERPVVNLNIVEGRIVQKCLLDILQNHAKMQKYINCTASYGGLRKKNVAMAVKEIYRSLRDKGHIFAKVTDIKSFFTKIKSDSVLNKIAEFCHNEDFMKLLKEGSVSLVMGKKKVSDLPIDIVYGKKDTTKQKIWDFMNRKTMEKEMDKLKETSSADSFASELPVIFYAQKYFHCLTDTSKKEGTKYEIEYLIAGKDSEKENLGAVFWKMIALRFLTNAACVYQDPVKEKEATLLAASVLGITGFPPVVAVAKNLLLIALAYGESVIDVRNLAEGKKVPIVKTVSDWQLSFSGLATLNCKQKPAKQGMKYEDYLLLLLIMQKDKRQKYFRMMDMMEQNIKRKVPDFKMDQCISSYKITQNLKLKKLGFGGMTLPFAPYTDLKLSRFTTY